MCICIYIYIYIHMYRRRERERERERDTLYVEGYVRGVPSPLHERLLEAYGGIPFGMLHVGMSPALRPGFRPPETPSLARNHSCSGWNIISTTYFSNINFASTVVLFPCQVCFFASSELLNGRLLNLLILSRPYEPRSGLARRTRWSI